MVWVGKALKALAVPPPSLAQVAPSPIQRDPQDPTGEEPRDTGTSTSVQAKGRGEAPAVLTPLSAAAISAHNGKTEFSSQ